MSDNLSYAWRGVPLSQIMPTSRLLDELEGAGYLTAGDVLDASPEELARDVYNVGLARAAKIRDAVWAYVRPVEIVRFDQAVAAGWDELNEPVPEPLDAIGTICALIAIGALLYFTARLLL